MSAASLSKKLQQWFETSHDNPPPAFNPAYRACGGKLISAVAEAMELEGFYSNHTRAECAAEIQRRMKLN